MPALKNPKDEKFAQGLAQGLPAAEAYRKAGFKDNRANASRKQRNDDIAQRVAEIVARDVVVERKAEERAVEKAIKDLSITREAVLKEQARIAFLDPGEVLSWKGNTVVLKDSTLLSPDVRAAISAIRNTKEGIAITFHSKAAALDALGKTLGIGSDKGQAPASVGLTADQLSDLEVARRLAFLLAKGAAQAQGD